VDAARTFAHAEKLVEEIGPREMASQENMLAGQYIFSAFADYGLENPHFEPFSRWGMAGRNVVATAPGTLYPEWIFLIGAHYDTIPLGVGSIDNATGMASLLEIAHYFGNHPPAYTIRFVAFDGEELGLIGSGYHYLQSALSGDLERSLLMLNLDMTQTNETSRVNPFIFFVLSSNAAAMEDLRQVRREMGLAASLVFRVPPDLAAEVSGGALMSDIQHWAHDPLILAWPWALSFDYHTIPGSLDQIDETALGISTKIILDFVRKLQLRTPAELQDRSTVAVDEEALRLLEAAGGIKAAR